MKFISIFYKLIFGILAALGLPFAVTSLLASISLGVIAAGIIIVSPEIALVIGVILFLSFLFQ